MERTTLDARALERGIQLFERLVADLPGLGAELETSARQYFRGPAPADSATPSAVSARRRHLEWFLFERVRGGAGERPVESVLDAWRARAGDALAEHASAFLDSHASIFEVLTIEPGRGALLRDMAGLGDYPVLEPEASVVFEEGDVIVGRLYPTDGAHRISKGAGFFRNPELHDAIERDLGRLREERRHPVLRIAQPELEAMFWGTVLPPESGDPVGDARRFLAASGLDEDEVDSLLALLAEAPISPATLVPGAGDRLGEVLERLAFETAADLDRARELLLAAWARLAAPATARTATAETRARQSADATREASAASESADPVRRAIDAFDRDRARGLDLDRSFERLERNLGLDGPLESSDEPEGDGAPDFPGVVGAVVEEFIWEVGNLEGPVAARALEPLRALGLFGERIGVLENLSGRDLLTFAGFWLPERGLLENGRDAAAMLAALRRFCAWAADAQALDLLLGFAEDLTGLERTLPRVTEANRALAHARQNGASAPAGNLLEFREPGAAEGALLLDAEGAPHRMRLESDLERHLEPGDRLRVRLASGSPAEVLRVYPPQIARLAEAQAHGSTRTR